MSIVIVPNVVNTAISEKLDVALADLPDAEQSRPHLYQQLLSFEPDEQGLRAFVFGKNFDNAGHWGLAHLADVETRARMKLWNPKNTIEGGIIEDAEQFVEMFVVLYQNDKAVAEIDLATLFAFACGTYAG